MLIKISIFIYALFLWAYLAVNLQWYAYKLKRVIFKSAKPLWHLYFFAIPWALQTILCFLYEDLSVYAALTLVYVAVFALWYRRLDKPLVFTGRIKRFLVAYIAVLAPPLFLFSDKIIGLAVLISLLIAHLISLLIEKRLALIYESAAILKLDSKPDRIVIAITASYGKTSMKNILTAILKTKYEVYATPKSVNTKKGVMKDINENLPDNAQIYIVEAGARQRGDIAEIAEFVRPHYAIIGKIGLAHLEYFGSIENTKLTKRELLISQRLKKAFIHASAVEPMDENVFGEEMIDELKADLLGISFLVNGSLYAAPLLGAFNAINVLAAILVAKELGVEDELISVALAKLMPIEHRLQRLEAGGKIIIDDSFNGNFEGMSEGVRLCAIYGGTKVIITPGIIEAGDEVNEKLAKKIDEVFDLVIITGSKNAKILNEFIKKPRKIILSDKTKLTQTLAKETQSGDLIYFANDAPNFI